ncbi:MAG TPA: diaminopimelate decarboxylase [Gaiella sp.]|nr:diaminopimelate decarboxylase [Gaiella sp.]
MLALFPDSAGLDGAQLTIGGVSAATLAEEHGTPLVVLCEETLRANARRLRAAVGDGRVFFGTKALPNVAVLRLLAAEGIGADVASAGELAFARRAGLGGEDLVVHGNNKDEALLAAAAAVGAPVVLDAPDEPGLAAALGVEQTLVRVTLGVDADTHEAIRTGHHGSKFGLPPDQARAALAEALELGLEVVGVHVHVGSQLADFDAQAETIVRLAAFVARCRDELGWTARVADLGGGFGIRHHPADEVPDAAELAATAATTARLAFVDAGLPRPEMWLEPGRCLVGRAGVTLYRVGSVKRLPERTWVAVDGGMSDNPRPQLYGARYTALSAARADEPVAEVVSVAGMHCESGDVLIDDVALPTPHRGDLLAVPATGAYTLAMASNYNGVPRPAAVFVADGSARLVRRRETIEDLLGAEVE